MNTAAELYNAVRKGQLARIKRLIGEEVDLNAKFGKYQEASLHVAAYRGDLETVQLLLENHADMNIKDKWQKTPLHHASENGQIEVAKFLIENGADINSQNVMGVSNPRDDRAERNFGVASVTLSTVIPRPSTTEPHVGFLYTPRGKRSQEKKKKLVEEDLQTPLHVSSGRGFEHITRLLLQSGAAVDLKDTWGQTAVYLASQYNRYNIVKMLKDHGADITIQNMDYKSPVFIATERHYHDIVKVLLGRENDLDMEENNDTSPT